MVKSKAIKKILESRTLNIHIRILTDPQKPLTLRKMLRASREVYDAAGIDINLASNERVTNVHELNDLDIGGLGGTHEPACVKVTDEQNQLAGLRKDVPDGDIVIYICRSLTNANAGCATHPKDKPMAAISATHADPYTMAHEVGHLLGLGHTTVQGENRLMTDLGTATLTSDPPPVLTPSEIDKARKSKFLR